MIHLPQMSCLASLDLACFAEALCNRESFVCGRGKENDLIARSQFLMPQAYFSVDCRVSTRPAVTLFFCNPAMSQFSTQVSGNRKPNAELSKEQRSAILSALELGQSPTKIAEDLRVSRKTVYRTRERYKQRGDVDSQPRSGRPKVFTRTTCRYISRLARRNPSWGYGTLSANAPGTPSRDTIRRILEVYSLHNLKARRPIPLKSITARKRRRFARI